MKKILIWGLAFLLVAAAAHIITLKATPDFIMNKAMQKLQERGVSLHRFVLAERTTPQTQTVVRPSPDLAYTICMYDFSKLKKPLEIKAGYWSDYGSVSFFDAQTNNFSTIRVGVDKKGIGAKILLVAKGIKAPEGRPKIEQQITSPTERGLILIRRLAPSAEKYSEIKSLSKNDKCGPAGGN